jgi:fimbrial chaperone protein
MKLSPGSSKVAAAAPAVPPPAVSQGYGRAARDSGWARHVKANGRGSFMRGMKVGAAAAAITALLAAVSAWAMTVQPVVLDLKPGGRDMSATITVQNTFTSPMPIGITVDALSFDQKGIQPTGKDPGDVIVYPPQALIPPGQTQTFRVLWAGDPELSLSRHYYVTVAQLPVKLPEGQSAIQILYNFQVLVNVGATNGKAQLSIASANAVMAETKPPPDQAAEVPARKQPEPEIVVRNDGPNYGYLSRTTIEITENDASGKEIFDKTLSPQEVQQIIGFGLLGPNTQRRVVIPVTLPTVQGTVKVRLLDIGDQP